jgi:hypothetical protein
MSTSTVRFFIAEVRYSIPASGHWRLLSPARAGADPGRRRSGPAPIRVTAMTRTSAHSIWVAHPSASGPSREADRNKWRSRLGLSWPCRQASRRRRASGVGS